MQARRSPSRTILPFITHLVMLAVSTAAASYSRQWLVALLLPLLLLTAAAAGEGSSSEVEALIKIWQGFTNADTKLPDWRLQDSSPCKWSGVECDRASGKVTELFLNDLDLTGTLSSSGWADLTSLRVALLYRNSLSGSIPEGWQLPPGLTELALDSNELEGPIPRDFVLPRSLKVLQLGYNMLTGPISPSWELPSGLEMLGIQSNRLSSFSPDWALPESLTTFYAYNNSFSGTLSADWRLPKSLESLDLGMNSLRGSIPQAWAIPKSIKEIYLDHNLLTGTVPAGWDLPSLSIAYLGYNNITGPLPAWKIPDMAQIQVMPQYGLGVCGEVPQSTPYYTWEPKVDDWIPLKNSDLTQCPQQQRTGWFFWRRSS